MSRPSSSSETTEGNHFPVVSLASRGFFFLSPATALFRFFSVLVAGGSWLKAQALPSILVLAMLATALRVKYHVGGALGIDDGDTSEGAGCTWEKMEKIGKEKILSFFPPYIGLEIERAYLIA